MHKSWAGVDYEGVVITEEVREAHVAHHIEVEGRVVRARGRDAAYQLKRALFAEWQHLEAFRVNLQNRLKVCTWQRICSC